MLASEREERMEDGREKRPYISWRENRMTTTITQCKDKRTKLQTDPKATKPARHRHPVTVCILLPSRPQLFPPWLRRSSASSTDQTFRHSYWNAAVQCARHLNHRSINHNRSARI